jgi:signal transduction histidine kinase
MDIKTMAKEARRTFNNAIFLMGIIPFLTFIYILAGKLGSFKMLEGEIGYILLALSGVILMGIVSGRQMLWHLVQKLFEFNEKILRMQEELIEKNRLAAITETVLTLGHEINNPLLVMDGNIERLKTQILDSQTDAKTKDLVENIKSGCERIMAATDKLSKLSKPVMSKEFAGKKIIDLEKSK